MVVEHHLGPADAGHGPHGRVGVGHHQVGEVGGAEIGRQAQMDPDGVALDLEGGHEPEVGQGLVQLGVPHRAQRLQHRGAVDRGAAGARPPGSDRLGHSLCPPTLASTGIAGFSVTSGPVPSSPALTPSGTLRSYSLAAFSPRIFFFALAVSSGYSFSIGYW